MNSSREYAPIALFVYNRPTHTRLTVEALLRNPESACSSLYVFSDGPKNANDNYAVCEVRKYLSHISGFAEIHIIERKHNWGLANSIIDGVTQLCNQFGRTIVLEDDLETSSYFLAYMNEALERFKDDESVAAVSGYMFPIKHDLGNRIFFRETPLSWGWATWNQGWAEFSPDGEALLTELKRKKKLFRFNHLGPQPFATMLRNQIAGKNNSWFVRWCASLFLGNKLTVMPTESLVKNIGIDGTGTHCAAWKFDPYEVELSHEPIDLKQLDASQSLKIERSLKRYFIKVRFLRYINFFYRILTR